MSWIAKPELEVGDAATLTSGGMAMTIMELVDGQATCAWFHKTGRDRMRVFPVKCLSRHDSVGDFNLIIEGFNATSEEIAELKIRKGGFDA